MTPGSTMTAAAKKKPAKTAAPVQPAPAPTVTSYKGFNPDWTCRGYQYRVGETYTHTGKVVACPTTDQAASGDGGFHACENPWDVLSYYSLVNDDGEFSRFAEVIQSGALARHSEDTKIASATLTVKLELSLADFIRRGIEWLIDKTIAHGPKDDGNAAQIGSSGNAARIGSSGYDARINSTGANAVIACAGSVRRFLADDVRALLDVTALAACKPIPGYAAVLRCKIDGATARVALTVDGRALSVMVVLTSPATALRLRVQLPAEFAIRSTEVLTREAA